MRPLRSGWARCRPAIPGTVRQGALTPPAATSRRSFGRKEIAVNPRRRSLCSRWQAACQGRWPRQHRRTARVAAHASTDNTDAKIRCAPGRSHIPHWVIKTLPCNPFRKLPEGVSLIRSSRRRPAAGRYSGGQPALCLVRQSLLGERQQTPGPPVADKQTGSDILSKTILSIFSAQHSRVRQKKRSGFPIPIPVVHMMKKTVAVFPSIKRKCSSLIISTEAGMVVRGAAAPGFYSRGRPLWMEYRGYLPFIQVTLVCFGGLAGQGFGGLRRAGR